MGTQTSSIRRDSQPVSLLQLFLLWDKKQCCKRSGTRFTHEWGEEICVNTLSQGINFAPRWADSNPEQSDHERRRHYSADKDTDTKLN